MNAIIFTLNILLVILLGWLGGLLMNKIKLPKVLGYIIAGMLIGPYAFNLISPGLTEHILFKILLAIAFGLVGFYIGSEIKLKEFKKGGSKIITIGLLEALVPFILVALVMYYIVHFDFYTSLIIGSIALATAPAVVLAVSKEYKTHGPITKILHPVIAMDDLLSVMVFGIIISFASSFYGSGTANLWAPFIAIGLALIFGLVGGFLLLWILSKIKNPIIYGITTSLFVMFFMFLSFEYGANALIAGMTLGIVCSNKFTKPQKQLFTKSNGKVIGLMMLIFLVLIGATLDITSIFSKVAIIGASLYAITRAAGKFIGAFIGTKITKYPKVVQKYLGLTLLPHAGISLTFIAMATPIVPTEYASLMGIIIGAATLVNEIISVFTIKKVFELSGEINKRPENH